MWCPWCGRRIKLGIVTPGGIVYHVWWCDGAGW